MATKKPKTQPFNNPFGQLSLKQQQAAPAPGAPAPRAPPAKAGKAAKPAPADEDAALFLEAVGAVAPVKRPSTYVPPPKPRAPVAFQAPTDEAESLARLAELVTEDSHFERVDEEDYVEGRVRGFDERVMKQLRAGQFRAQAELDLHGQRLEQARTATEAFIGRARVDGHRCVRLITGKGLHSEDGTPTLRNAVVDWLTRGRSARQVLAYCSCRPVDGGSGALSVLLRR